jgi:hypothetical protein
VRAQLRREDVDPDRRRELLEEALGHIDRQLELVERRAAELAKLKAELSETRKRVRRKIRELETPAETGIPAERGKLAGGECHPASVEGACLPAAAEGAFPPVPAPPESTPEPAR